MYDSVFILIFLSADGCAQNLARVCAVLVIGYT